MQQPQHTKATHEHEAHETLTRTKIWKVFGVLLLITVVEFILALVIIPKGLLSQSVGNFLYIALTLLKAFYIVAYFMHLKFEKKALQITLTFTFFFIFFFIVLMLIEGNYIGIHMFK